jgi:hypothetical protein
MDVPQIGTCELEWRRQRSFYYNTDGPKSDRSKSKEILPVVELKPFTKQVWRRARSFPDYQSLHSVGLVHEDSPREPRDNKQIYRDTLLFLAELESQKLLESYEYDVKGKKIPRFPQIKQFPVRPFGFATTEDRGKVTFDDIKSGANENTRFSCLKKALSEDDLARQQKIAVRGRPVPADNSNGKYIHAFPYAGEWMTRSATMPLGRDVNSNKVNFYSRAATMLNDLNGHYDSPVNPGLGHLTGEGQRLGMGQNAAPFLVKDVPLLPKNRRTGAESPKDDTRTHAYSDSDTRYLHRDKYGADNYSLPGDQMNRQYTNPEIERQLSKISGSTSVKNVPVSNYHNLLTKNLVVRTLGPPTQGELSLKVGIVSNMHPRSRNNLNADGSKGKKRLKFMPHESLANFMAGEADVKSAPGGIIEGSQVNTGSPGSKRMQRANRSRHTMSEGTKGQIDALSDDSESVSMDRAMAAMTPDDGRLIGGESKMALRDDNEKPVSSYCSRNIKTPKSITFDPNPTEIEDNESVRQDTKSVTPWPAPPEEPAEDMIVTVGSFPTVAQEDGTPNNPHSTPNTPRQSLPQTPESNAISSRGSSRKLHVDLKTAYDETEEFLDEEEPEIPLAETPQPSSSRGKTFLTSRTPASAVPEEELNQS